MDTDSAAAQDYTRHPTTSQPTPSSSSHSPPWATPFPLSHHDRLSRKCKLGHLASCTVRTKPPFPPLSLDQIVPVTRLQMPLWRSISLIGLCPRSLESPHTHLFWFPRLHSYLLISEASASANAPCTTLQADETAHPPPPNHSPKRPPKLSSFPSVQSEEGLR